MIALLRPFWGRILQWGGAAVGVALLLLKVRQSGKDAARVEQLKKNVEVIEDAKKVESRVDALPDGDAAKQLRERWSR